MLCRDVISRHNSLNLHTLSNLVVFEILKSLMLASLVSATFGSSSTDSSRVCVIVQTLNVLFFESGSCTL